MKNQNGEWILESEAKADLFRDTFSAKSKLPDREGEWKPKQLTTEQASFLTLRTKATEAILKGLDPDKATGPDSLPGRILKMCASELALPVTKLAREMLKRGEWPDCWRDHWLTPIFKKGSVADPQKYRCVHLTAVLSKVVEGVIAQHLVAYWKLLAPAAIHSGDFVPAIRVEI